MSDFDSQTNDDATLRSDNTANSQHANSTLRLDVGSVFQSKYKVTERIGSGGMGIVYRCTQLLIDKDVAIKTLTHASMNDEAVIRFQTEARAAGSLSHANLLSVHDFGTTEEGVPYMVMDYVPGTTLQDLLQRTGQLSLPMVLDLFIECADGLAHAHAQKVLHRDIKPSNIMLLENEIRLGTIRILDFGIAKIGGDSTKTQELTKTGVVLGSPLYMSPEQGIGKKIDARTDIYSLGCVLYECISGSPPLAGETIIETLMKHQIEAPKPLSEASMGREIPQALDSLVMKMLSKDANERTASMEEVRDKLIEIRELKRNGEVLPKTNQAVDQNPPCKNLLWSKLSNVKVITGLLSAFALAVTVYLFQTLIFTPTVTNKPLVQIDAHVASPDLEKLGYDKKVEKILTENAERGYSDARILANEFTFNQFRMIQACKWIRTLTLGESTNIIPEGLRLLRDNPITELRLDRSELNDQCLEAVSEFKNLRVLSINYAKGITSSGIQYLVKLRGLKTLSMRAVPVTIDTLDKLLKNGELWEIDLDDNPLITDSYLRVIGSFKKGICVSLMNTNVTDNGVKYLGKKVLFLCLRGNRQITDSAMETLSNQCPDIRSLDVANTGVTAKGILMLRKLPALNYLNLSPMQGETAKDRADIIRVFRDQKHVRITGI